MAAPTAGTDYTMLISSVAATAMCWGVYGPLLKWGHEAMEKGGGRMRPFICVGVAYLVVAIVLPIVAMQTFGYDKGQGLFHGWTFSGITWSFIAGTAGALGAFGLLLALGSGAGPAVVMPLVFGFAPAVNTLFTLYFLTSDKSKEVIVSPFFFVGLIMIGLGAVVTLMYQPKAKPRGGGDKAAATASEKPGKDGKKDSKDATKALTGDKKKEEEKKADKEETKKSDSK